jgi:plasmid maintenance system killer protein
VLWRCSLFFVTVKKFLSVECNIPCYIRGKLKGYYAVNVSGNWRIIFRFEDGDVDDVDYLDYH